MHSASFGGEPPQCANSFFFACFFSLRGNRFLSFFTSFGIFFLGAVGCAMPVFTAIVPIAEPIALAAFCSISEPAVSGCWAWGSAFFLVAIATKHTTSPCHNFFSRAKFVVEDRG